MLSLLENYRYLVKKYFLFVCMGLTFTLVLPLPLFYVTDPLQIFHKSWFHDGNRLNTGMREQAAGIINNFEFDSIILGTSMLENTSAHEASEKIGGKFFNISMSGSNFFERSFVLAKVLKKNLKNVIYSLDEYYRDCRDEGNYSTRYWAFLYDDNKLNDFYVYFQTKYICNIHNPLVSTGVVDIDRPNAWYKLAEHAARFGGLENWVKHIDNIQVHDFLLKVLPEAAKRTPAKNVQKMSLQKRIQKAISHIEKYLLCYVKQYPETTFYLIFPPYYRYHYADLLQHRPEDFFLHQEVVRYMAQQGRDLQNLHIYGFEDELFVNDIANYQDTLHYHDRFNSYFLDAIASKTHELTSENVDAYLERCRKEAEAFDIAALNARAQELIRQQNTAGEEQ